jgi:hypothetical protein
MARCCVRDICCARDTCCASRRCARVSTSLLQLLDKLLDPEGTYLEFFDHTASLMNLLGYVHGLSQARTSRSFCGPCCVVHLCRDRGITASRLLSCSGACPITPGMWAVFIKLLDGFNRYAFDYMKEILVRMLPLRVSVDVAPCIVASSHVHPLSLSQPALASFVSRGTDTFLTGDPAHGINFLELLWSLNDKVEKNMSEVRRSAARCRRLCCRLCVCC